MYTFPQVADVDPTDGRFTQSTTIMPPSETTASKFSIDISITKETDEDNSLDRWDSSTPKISGDELTEEDKNDILAIDGRGSRMYEIERPEEVTSENLWERTEVLAGKDRFPPGFSASLLCTHVWFGEVIHWISED